MNARSFFKITSLLFPFLLAGLSFDLKAQQSNNEPLFFVDSVRVSKTEKPNLNPNDIGMISVYKGKNATDLAGPEAANGVIYIETIPFVRNRYWNLFKSKSADYLKLLPKPGVNKDLVYILNGKPLDGLVEPDLGSINSSNLISVEVIDARRLSKDYKINICQWGVVVTTKAN